MTAPTPEQVDAVARTLHDAEHHDVHDCDCDATGIGGPWSEDAETILTTTDPAARAALAESLPTEVMLAALTERGALKAAWAVQHAQGTHLGPFTEKEARRWLANDVKRDETRRYERRGKQDLLRRLVTPWEVAP